MKRNLTWLFLVLLVCAGLGIQSRWFAKSAGQTDPSSKAPEPGTAAYSGFTHVSMYLGQKPPGAGGDFFSLSLTYQAHHWQGEHSLHQNGLITQMTPIVFDHQASQLFDKGLLDNPGWRTPQATEPGPTHEGDRRLFTHLEIQQEGRTYTSDWNGLPPAQAEVANVFLVSPAGPAIRQAISKLSSPASH